VEAVQPVGVVGTEVVGLYPATIKPTSPVTIPDGMVTVNVTTEVMAAFAEPPTRVIAIVLSCRY
jgi:hypothetical protein